jgi:hypothetical protein
LCHLIKTATYHQSKHNCVFTQMLHDLDWIIHHQAQYRLK